jgi:pimeloyl-ACP methyl ester carboxylesterase
VLVLGGEKSGGEFLIAQAKLAASTVQGKIISGSGHWLIDEAPQTVIPALVAFINDPVATASASAKVPQEANTSK